MFKQPNIHKVENSHERMHIYDMLKMVGEEYQTLNFETFAKCFGSMFSVKMTNDISELPMAAIGSRYTKASEIINVDDLDYHCTKDDIINYIEFLQIFSSKPAWYTMPSLIRSVIGDKNFMFSVIKNPTNVYATECCCNPNIHSILETMKFKPIKDDNGNVKYYIHKPETY